MCELDISFQLLREIAPPADRYLRILDFLSISIKQLQLTQCEEPENIQMIPKALSNIVIKKATHVPQLHRIVLEIDSSLVEIVASEFRRILNTTEHTGTDIVVLNNYGCSKDRGRRKGIERNWGFDEDVKWETYYQSFNHRPVYEVIDVQL